MHQLYLEKSKFYVLCEFFNNLLIKNIFRIKIILKNKMEIKYQKLKVYDTYVEKEFRFNNKNKQVVSIWLKLTEDQEFGHSKLLEEDLKTDKILNKKESKEFVENAIDNFYKRIIHNYTSIDKLFINISYKPEKDLKNFVNRKEKKFSCRVEEC